VPEGRPLKKFTTPPRRTIARACCHVAGLPRCFDHGIRSKLVFGKRLYGGYDIVRLRDVEGDNRAQTLAISSGAARRATDDANAARSMRTKF